MATQPGEGDEANPDVIPNEFGKFPSVSSLSWQQFRCQVVTPGAPSLHNFVVRPTLALSSTERRPGKSPLNTPLFYNNSPGSSSEQMLRGFGDHLHVNSSQSLSNSGQNEVHYTFQFQPSRQIVSVSQVEEKEEEDRNEQYEINLSVVCLGIFPAELCDHWQDRQTKPGHGQDAGQQQHQHNHHHHFHQSWQLPFPTGDRDNVQPDPGELYINLIMFCFSGGERVQLVSNYGHGSSDLISESIHLSL